MSAKYKIEIKHEAVIEIEDAFYWYESKQVKLGNRFKKHLDQSIKSISKSPNGFKIINGNQRQFSLKTFPFVVIYEVFDDCIVIFAVFHTSKNPKDKIR